MKILILGDIFGDCGLNYLSMVLPEIKRDNDIDFCIANGENTSGGNGLSYGDYYKLCDIGVDAITMGNHTFGRKDIYNILDRENNVVRPINYPEGTVGRGSTILKSNGKKIGIINAMGRVNLMNIDCPFKATLKEAEKLKDRCDIIIVDFHGEATSEKVAMGYYLDGKVTCVFGTHTHVQTADETILPRGTAYITDVGMTGAIHSVLGVEKEVIIDRFLTSVPQKFSFADGKAKVSGIILTVDDESNKCLEIKRILYKD